MRKISFLLLNTKQHGILFAIDNTMQSRLAKIQSPVMASLESNDIIIPSLDHDLVDVAAASAKTDSLLPPTQHVTTTIGLTPEFGALNSKQLNKLKWNVGRAPWYDDRGRAAAPFFIGVTGGSASGKTSVCKAIVEKLSLPWVGLLSMDRYYRGLTDEEQHAAHQGNYNFDHPDAFDMNKLHETITEMKTGKAVDVPIYDFATHARLPETDRMYGVDVVIVEGILLFYDKKVRDLLDLKIYVDTDSDLRLARRIGRDIRERGRTVEGVLEQYQRTVKPSFEEYILPTKRFADLIVPWNDTNNVAIDLLSQHIISRLEKRGHDHLLSRQSLPHPRLLLPNQLPENITILEPSQSLKAIHTIIRDVQASPDDFNFHLKRLVRLLTSTAISQLEFKPHTVTTPTTEAFHGLDLSSKIVAVSIVRTGEVFETAIRSVLPDVPVGKIVIQQNDALRKEDGPRLYYAKLPSQITSPDTTVLLFDGVLATGGAVNMAVHVLLDHGVPEDKIVFCCIDSAPEGLHKVTTTFPRLRIVTSWVDEGLDNKFYCKPGVGYLGDRYFGTGAGAPPAEADEAVMSPRKM